VSDLQVRRYEPRDADVVWDLHERALRDVGAYDEAYAHLDADLRAVREEYLAAGGEFLVGERDDRVVAMGAFQPATAVDHHTDDPNAAVIRRMRVDPAHQRRGYGATILRRLERRADEAGFERHLLDTTPDQEAAIDLYRSFGYTETHRKKTPAGEMIYFEKEL